ncbi:MAG: DUF3343 domain-containing protein [Planctomycetes bacterium]|nr:DUF3343 domain-containing protein [Planctomycetota bacterium]MBL7044760.1 DUF3343 domain-containing protein [Pirellulaceae bacterium]
MDDQGVVLFYAVHFVFKLEKALRARGVSSKPIPTPRHLSSDCGTALRFPWEHRREVEAAIAELDLEIEGIHHLVD